MPMGFMARDQYDLEYEGRFTPVDEDQMSCLRNRLADILIGVDFGRLLSIPISVLPAFEPSQVGTISGALLDASIPELKSIIADDRFESLGIRRAPGQLGERESYPDYVHDDGWRLELKLLYVDNASLPIKRPPTPKEPSARLTQKVSLANVQPSKDFLLVIAYAFKEDRIRPGIAVPTIVDLELFPVIECIHSRDVRLYESSHGGWFGNFDTPVVLSKLGKKHRAEGIPIDYSSYGRKEDEEKDLNEDTNFGKLKRIPYPPLKKYLAKCRQPITEELSVMAKRIIDEMQGEVQ